MKIKSVKKGLLKADCEVVSKNCVIGIENIDETEKN